MDPLFEDMKTSREIGTSDQRWMRNYLRLCEDQCEMRAAGWVTDETWKLWWEGIYSFVSTDRFHDEVARYELSGSLTNLRRGLVAADSSKPFDPAELTGVARWWRGLSGLLDPIGRKSGPDIRNGDQTTTAAAD
jgi:hypothetical protein